MRKDFGQEGINTRIKKGEVLNPNGRPKKAESYKNLIEEFGNSTLIEVSYTNDKGEIKEIKLDGNKHSINAILVAKLFQMAIIGDGNLGAIKELFDRREGKVKEQSNDTPLPQINGIEIEVPEKQLKDD
jgi:hypothetical protein